MASGAIPRRLKSSFWQWRPDSSMTREYVSGKAEGVRSEVAGVEFVGWVSPPSKFWVVEHPFCMGTDRVVLSWVFLTPSSCVSTKSWRQVWPSCPNCYYYYHPVRSLSSRFDFQCSQFWNSRRSKRWCGRERRHKGRSGSWLPRRNYSIVF